VASTRKEVFVPTLHFVNPGDTKDRRARNVHAQRQVVRKNRWLAQSQRQALERVKASGRFLEQVEWLEDPQSLQQRPSKHGGKGVDRDPEGTANTVPRDPAVSEPRRATSLVSWSYLEGENRPPGSSFPSARSPVRPPPSSLCVVPGASTADPFSGAHLTPKNGKLMDKYANFCERPTDLISWTY
jgi:hypothetical protein